MNSISWGGSLTGKTTSKYFKYIFSIIGKLFFQSFKKKKNQPKSKPTNKPKTTTPKNPNQTQKTRTHSRKCLAIGWFMPMQIWRNDSVAAVIHWPLQNKYVGPLYWSFLGKGLSFKRSYAVVHLFISKEIIYLQGGCGCSNPIFKSQETGWNQKADNPFCMCNFKYFFLFICS